MRKVFFYYDKTWKYFFWLYQNLSVPIDYVHVCNMVINMNDDNNCNILYFKKQYVNNANALPKILHMYMYIIYSKYIQKCNTIFIVIIHEMFNEKPIHR